MVRTRKNFSSRQTELLDQIWLIFLQLGYQDTTLSLIIRELNISKGVFYHYFESKEHCAKAAVEYYSENSLEEVIKRCEENDYKAQPPLKKLKMLMEQGRALFIENTDALKGIDSSANKVFHEMLMVALTKKF